ncbi:MAG: FkbM family methyltransferase [Candidatus Nanoarchaeia archaeon]
MNVFELELYNEKILFSVEDEYSSKWFYPRYKNNGVHERKVTELIIENCKRAKNFVDVGAHIGFFTCVVGKIFPGINVHSFEIQDTALKLLQKNIELNKLNNVRLYNCGVADVAGVSFYQPTNFPDEKSALTNVGKKVKTIKLDSLDFVPDVVKIDVEGTELDVLRGMKKILPKVKAVFVEIHPHLYEKNTIKKILECLKDFRIYEICDHRRRGDPDIIKVESADFPYNNMLYAFRR